MKTLIEILDEQILKSRSEEYGDKKKTSFWASESEVMAFDIYHRWKGTPPTNPITEEKLMMLQMRKLTEVAVVDLVRRSGTIIEELSNGERMYFEWGEHKTPISGYPDIGVNLNGQPTIVEVKTYYGNQQQYNVANGKVKMSYLIQLCLYMYHWNIPNGILFMINQGTGERYSYDVFRKGEYHFICQDNDVEINLLDTLKRFEQIYVNHILPDVEPDPEFIYKYDIEKLNWDEVSAANISKARMNKGVIGDWQVKYSDFKDLIVKKQGTCLGYTPEEVKYIREKTDGYTTKRSGAVKFNPADL